jgi:hypothetical protein
MIYLIANNSARLIRPIESRDRKFSNCCRNGTPKYVQNAVNLA